jgi:dTDP-4-dehydrorhamnose reductase
MVSLVIGASGKIGKYFLDNKRQKLLLTFNKNKFKGGLKYDILKDKIYDIILKYKISKVVLLSACSDPDYCKKNLEISNQLNVVKTKKLISDLIKFKIYFIFFSTEFVFDGKKGRYSENDRTKPINIYGKQKLEIEKYIKQNTKNYCIFRIAKTYGDNFRDNTLVVDFIKKSKQRKVKIFAAKDQKFSPLFSKDLVKITNLFLRKKITGTFNIGGPKIYSRYGLYSKFNKLIKKSKKYNKINLIATNLKNFKFIDKRPKDVSFNIKKLNKVINFKLTNIEKVLIENL